MKYYKLEKYSYDSIIDLYKVCKEKPYKMPSLNFKEVKQKYNNLIKRIHENNICESS